MGEVISFISLKGGVGKTTLALETASSLVNDFGKKVLLVDGNFSAPNIHLHLDIDPETSLHNVINGDEEVHSSIYEVHGIDVLPSSLDFYDNLDYYKLKKVLEKFVSRYDFIIIDSSPHHSELLPVVAASHKLFLITTPDEVTLTTSLKAAKLAKQDKLPIQGIIINKIKNSAYEKTLEEIEQDSSLPVLARIKDHKKIIEANFFKTPITIHDPYNKISKEIRNFSAVISGVPEKRNFLSNILRRDFSKEKINREVFRKKFYEASF